ncbi:MAG: hypothetical protein LBW85_05110 [Deltaproteobacteria bacterium]|jgi:hypothetical protein|nr:hypothetical protein [Deltaproteobacteria bacterium]
MRIRPIGTAVLAFLLALSLDSRVFPQTEPPVYPEVALEKIFADFANDPAAAAAAYGGEKYHLLKDAEVGAPASENMGNHFLPMQPANGGTDRFNFLCRFTADPQLPEIMEKASKYRRGERPLFLATYNAPDSVGKFVVFKCHDVDVLREAASRMKTLPSQPHELTDGQKLLRSGYMRRTAVLQVLKDFASDEASAASKYAEKFFIITDSVIQRKMKTADEITAARLDVPDSQKREKPAEELVFWCLIGGEPANSPLEDRLVQGYRPGDSRILFGRFLRSAGDNLSFVCADPEAR